MIKSLLPLQVQSLRRRHIVELEMGTEHEGVVKDEQQGESVFQDSEKTIMGRYLTQYSAESSR